MTFDYSIAAEETIIVARVSGVPDRNSVVEFWREVVATARKHDCHDVLGLASTERPMELGDALEIEAIFRAAGVTSDFRIAWLNPNPAARPMIDLVEELIRNREIADARFFESEADAREWLAGTP